MNVNNVFDTIGITEVEEGSITVSITNNSQSSCSYEEVIVLSLCDLGLTLSMDDESCRLIAETEELVCFCPSGSISGTITNVTSIPNNELAVSRGQDRLSYHKFRRGLNGKI